jgi:hypothetical protein
MENDKSKMWSYSYKFIQPLSNDWINNLDHTELEMIFLDMMSCDLEKKDCDEARDMLKDIGIKC